MSFTALSRSFNEGARVEKTRQLEPTFLVPVEERFDLQADRCSFPTQLLRAFTTRACGAVT